MTETKRNWIFLRGLGRHSIHWGPFIDSFRKLFPEDSIELLDLRGTGRLAHSPSYLSISENVRDLRARSLTLPEKGSAHLLTISLGSMVGVEWAHRHPDEIKGLVTINTSDRGSSPFFDRMRPHNYLPLLKTLTTSSDPLKVEEKILDLTTRNLKTKTDWARTFAQAPLTNKSNFLRQLMAAGTYRFPEHKPRTEILMLCSQGDQLVNPRCTQMISEMWTLKPHTHPEAGHDLPLEAPDWVCEEISNWLTYGS